MDDAEQRRREDGKHKAEESILSAAGRTVSPGVPAGGEAPAWEGRLRSRSSCQAEGPEGRRRANGKDALGPVQGTIKYIILIYYG